jgi:hypothetical protein
MWELRCSMYHNTMGLHGLLQGQLYALLFFFFLLSHSSLPPLPTPHTYVQIYIPEAFAWRDLRKLHETSVSIAGTLPEIKIQHLPNMSQEGHCYTNLFSTLISDHSCLPLFCPDYHIWSRSDSNLAQRDKVFSFRTYSQQQFSFLLLHGAWSYFCRSLDVCISLATQIPM